MAYTVSECEIAITNGRFFFFKENVCLLGTKFFNKTRPEANWSFRHYVYMYTMQPQNMCRGLRTKWWVPLLHSALFATPLVSFLTDLSPHFPHLSTLSLSFLLAAAQMLLATVVGAMSSTKFCIFYLLKPLRSLRCDGNEELLRL